MLRVAQCVLVCRCLVPDNPQRQDRSERQYQYLLPPLSGYRSRNPVRASIFTCIVCFLSLFLFFFRVSSRATQEMPRSDRFSSAIRKPCQQFTLGLYILFRQTKRKTEGPQHFAFPEISRENRGCLVLHSGNSRVSLSLSTESWYGAKSEAKLRKSARYPGGRRVISRYTRVLREIPGILPIWPKIWLILGPNQPQTRLRARKI